MFLIYYVKKYFEEILTLLSFGVIVFKFPILYDESYDSFCNNQLIGQFTEKPLMDLYYLAWIGFNELYKLLHTLFPLINWGGLGFLIFSIVGLFLILYSCRILFKQLNVKPLSIFFIQVFFAIIYVDNFMSITHTRFSILYCSLSLILLALQHKLQKKHYLIYTLIFIIGMLHRPESGFGLFIFVGIGIVFIQKEKIIFLAKRWFLPLLSTIILLVVFLIDWHQTNRFEKKIEPNIEYALTTKRIVDVSSMESMDDSLKYQMANYGIFIDENFVSLEFLNEITKVSFKFNPSKFKNSLRNICQYASYYIYFPFLIGFLILFTLFRKNNWNTFTRFLIMNGLFILIYAYIEYNTGISNRHLSVFLIIQSILSLYLFFSAKPLGHNYSILTSLFLLVLWIPAWLTAKNYSEKYMILSQEVSCFNETMHQIENHYQNKIIVVSLFNFKLFDRHFNFFNKQYKGNTYILYDLSYYSLVPPNQAYLASLCNCNPKDPVDFFTWLEKEDGLYISVDKRFELIEIYMNDIRRVDFEFYKNNDDLNFEKPICISKNTYGNFEIKRISISK